MSDFKAKMHQIRFQLGLRRRPRAPPDTLAVFKAPTSKGRKGKEGNEREGEGRWGEGRGGRWGGWEHASIGIFESRRLCPLPQH